MELYNFKNTHISELYMIPPQIQLYANNAIKESHPTNIYTKHDTDIYTST
jgi:hypothetical protein